MQMQMQMPAGGGGGGGGPPPPPFTFGMKFKLRHATTGNRLHSHYDRYPDGSHQQQVTGFPGHDDNDWWVVIEPFRAPRGRGAVPDGGMLRLMHFETKALLHSHHIPSAGTHLQGLQPRTSAVL